MPLTSAQRQERLRATRTSQGLKELRNVWVHPEDELAIRAFASALALKRLAGSSPAGSGPRRLASSSADLVLAPRITSKAKHRVRKR